MGLPFLNAKKIGSIIIAKTKPDGGVEPLHEEGEETPELMYAAEDLIKAVHSKDTKSVAEALRSAFEMLQSMPPEEMGE